MSLCAPTPARHVTSARRREVCLFQVHSRARIRQPYGGTDSLIAFALTLPCFSYLGSSSLLYFEKQKVNCLLGKELGSAILFGPSPVLYVRRNQIILRPTTHPDAVSFFVPAYPISRLVRYRLQFNTKHPQVHDHVESVGARPLPPLHGTYQPHPATRSKS